MVAAHRPEQAGADGIRAYDPLIEDDTADQSWVSQWSDLDTNRLTSRKSPRDVGEHIKMLWIGNCSKRGALPISASSYYIHNKSYKKRRLGSTLFLIAPNLGSVPISSKGESAIPSHQK
jgi:hypothetical protein